MKDDDEFQEKCAEVGKVFRDVIVKLMESEENFTPNQIISGAALAVAMAQISMRPSDMSQEEASAMYVAMVAQYLAFACEINAKVEEEDEEEEFNNLKKVMQ